MYWVLKCDEIKKCEKISNLLSLKDIKRIFVPVFNVAEDGFRRKPEKIS
jgi:hypothetical protein